MACKASISLVSVFVDLIVIRVLSCVARVLRLWFYNTRLAVLCIAYLGFTIVGTVKILAVDTTQGRQPCAEAVRVFSPFIFNF